MLINVYISENLSEFKLYTNSTYTVANQLLDYFFSWIKTSWTFIKRSLHLYDYYESYILPTNVQHQNLKFLLLSVLLWNEA